MNAQWESDHDIIEIVKDEERSGLISSGVETQAYAVRHPKFQNLPFPSFPMYIRVYQPTRNKDKQMK